MKWKVGDELHIKRGRGWSKKKYTVSEINEHPNVMAVNIGQIGSGVWWPDNSKMLESAEKVAQIRAALGVNKPASENPQRPTYHVLRVLSDGKEHTIEEIFNEVKKETQFGWWDVSCALSYLKRKRVKRIKHPDTWMLKDSA
jgi:hypothetical protein